MKLVESMVSTLNARVIEPEEVKDCRISEYELVGFGSEIYFEIMTQVCLNSSTNCQSLIRNHLFFQQEEETASFRTLTTRFFRESLWKKATM